MLPYKDIGGDSGIIGYQAEDDAIIVYFKDGASYRYSYASAGQSNIEMMKKLATAGNGLNAFINRNCRRRYERRIR